MGKYIGYAIGGSYGYKTPSGSTGGEDSSNHYYAGVYGTTSTYYSIVHFPAINEVNKNLVIQNAKVRIKSNSGGPCSTAQIYVTSSSDKYSTEGVLAATNETITISNSSFTTLNLNDEGCKKIAEYHSQGKPFYLRFTSAAAERYRFIGYKNYAYPDEDHYGAPMLEFDYNYGASTGTLNSNTITLGESISLNILSLSADYVHTIDWYLNDKLLDSQTKIGGGNSNFLYNSSLATNVYFPSSTSSTSQGKVVLKTSWNNTQIGISTYYFTVNIGNTALPIMGKPSFTFQDKGSTDREYCLQNFSSVYCTTRASGVAGASIVKVQIVVSGAASGNFSFSKNLSNTKLDISLTKSGMVTVTATATDSRGKTTSTSNSFTVEAYSIPKFTNFDIYRCDSLGNKNTEGTYIRGIINYSFSEIYNNTVELFEKKINNVTSDNISLNNNDKQILVTPSPIDSSLAIIKITLEDNFGGSSTKEISISAINYLMHFRDGAIGIGSPALNNNALTIGFPVKFANSYLENAPARNLILKKATWLNNEKNNETYNIIFERPDDGIYEGRIDMINDGYRFYAYHKTTPSSNPVTVMNLDIINKKLSVGELALTNPLSPSYGGTGYNSLAATREAIYTRKS